MASTKTWNPLIFVLVMGKTEVYTALIKQFSNVKRLLDFDYISSSEGDYLDTEEREGY